MGVEPFVLKCGSDFLVSVTCTSSSAENWRALDRVMATATTSLASVVLLRTTSIGHAFSGTRKPLLWSPDPCLPAAGAVRVVSQYLGVTTA